MNQLGLCIARKRPEKCCWCVFKASPNTLAGFEGFLCADDDVIYDLYHPYMDQEPSTSVRSYKHGQFC